MKKVKQAIAPSVPDLKSVSVLHTSHNLLWLIVIPVLVIIIYKSVLNYKLVNWDDKRYLKETPMIQDLSLENVKLMFSKKVLRSYNPLVILSFAVDNKVAALKPEWCHGVNLFFHIINALLVFACMKKMRFRTEAAGLISLLFAVHPLSTEAVAWIAGRKDVLYGFFYLLAWICYINFYNKRRNFQYILSLLFFILSLLSKVQAITFPFVLIITDYILFRQWSRKSLVNKIPFFILSLIFGLVAVNENNLVADTYSLSPTVLDKIIYSVMAFGLYLQKLIFPFYQSAIYSFPDSGSADFYRLLITGIIALMLIIYGVYITIKKAPAVAGGLLIYAISIGVVLHIVAFNSALIYERFTYLGCIGLFISILSLDKLFPRWRSDRIKILSAVFLFFSFLTYSRAFVWKDSISLWNDTIEKNPNASEALNNRGMEYLEKGEYDLALNDFDACIKLKPNRPDAYNNRSIVYYNKKDFKNALADNSIVLKIDSVHHEGISNRGCFYFNSDQFDSAIYYYTYATKLMPENSSAFYFCGAAYYKKGMYEKALEEYNDAIRIFPGYTDAFAYSGACYADLDKFDSAMICVNKAEQITPASVARLLVSSEYINRGSIAFGKGDSEAALKLYKLASEAMPANADAYYYIGGILISRGDVPGAREYWRKALSLDPNHKLANEWMKKIGDK